MFHIFCRDSSSAINTCADLINYLKLNVLEKKSDPFTIEIRRSTLLKDALKEAKKAKFKPTKPMKVLAAINSIFILW